MLGVQFPFSIYTRQDPSHGMVFPTFKVALHISINTVKIINLSRVVPQISPDFVNLTININHHTFTLSNLSLRHIIFKP